MRKRSKGVKYSRVTKQQKYIFLSLVIQKGQSLHEAASNAGIQYSTGKTILFFYKNKHNKYGSYEIEPTDYLAQIYNFASYRAITPQEVCPQIEIIMGRKQFMERPRPQPIRTTRITRRSCKLAKDQQRSTLPQDYHHSKDSHPENYLNTPIKQDVTPINNEINEIHPS